MPNPFSKIFREGIGTLTNSGKTSSVIGVDIGSSTMKVVQLKKKGAKAILETYGALALGPYAELQVGQTTNLPPEKLALALTDILREAGVTTKDAAISIPASASLVFLIELPAMLDDRQLPAIIPTEARKYIPVPVSEVSLDWWVIPKKETEFEAQLESQTTKEKVVPKTEVLVAAIHNDTLTKYRDVVAKASVDASFFEIELFSSIRSSFNRELSTVLIMDVGALKTKLSIIEYGIVRKFHSINRGSQDISNALSQSLAISFLEAEQMKREFGLHGSSKNPHIAEIISLSVDFILAETTTVISAYSREHNKPISKVILTGGGVLLKGFLERAIEELRTEVVMAEPFDKVEAPAFLEGVLKSAGPEFAVAAGLALRRLQESA